MNTRLTILQGLYAAPRFKGRDWLIGSIATSFASKPSRLPDGLLLDLDPAEWPQLDLKMHGAREPETLRLFKRLVSPGDTIIDVGAHIGHHAMLAARACQPGGRVLTFDPQPYNCDRIARNAELNGFRHVRVVCAAVGAKDAVTTIPLQSVRDRSRLSLAAPSPNDGRIGIEVPLLRLDTYFAAHGVKAARLLKIDVEGYELEVLRGLGERIRDCSNIVLELLDTTAPETAKEILALLARHGFVLRDVTGAAWAEDRPLPEHNLWAERL